MDGGPTHFETFDPKPEAAVEIRGELSAMPDQDPRCALLAAHDAPGVDRRKIAVVRSVCHNQGNHGAGNHYMMTGSPPRIPVGCGAFVSFHPSLGSVAATSAARRRVAGLLFDAQHVAFGRTEFSGSEVRALRCRRRSERQGISRRDVALPEGLTSERFETRRDLRQLVDRFQRIDEQATADPVAQWTGIIGKATT